MVNRKRRVVTDEMLEALKEAHKNGESLVSLEIRFNLKPNTLVYWAAKLGLKFKIGKPKGYCPSDETRRRLSESAHNRKLFNLKKVERDAAIVNDYLKDKDQTWSQLAEKHNIKESEIKVIIGQHLMRVCRADDECPFKPLLPEYKEVKSVG